MQNREDELREKIKEAFYSFYTGKMLDVVIDEVTNYVQEDRKQYVEELIKRMDYIEKWEANPPKDINESMLAGWYIGRIDGIRQGIKAISTDAESEVKNI